MKVSPNSQLSIPSSSPLSTQWVTQWVSQSAETMTGRTWYRHHHHTSYYHLLGWHNFRSIKVEKWFLTMPKMLILFKFLYPHSSSGASATVLGRERREAEKQWHHPLWGNRHHQQSTTHPLPPSTLVIHVAKYNNKKNTFSCSYFRFAFIKGSAPSTTLPPSHTHAPHGLCEQRIYCYANELGWNWSVFIQYFDFVHI